MSKGVCPYLLSIVLASVMLAACQSGAQSERDAHGQAKPPAPPDGSIRLTPAQIEANGIQTAPVTEQELVSTITVIGRVVPRAGYDSVVFSPFAGRLIADPARFPRIGSHLKKGDTIGQVEQIFTASESLQIAATYEQLKATVQQAEQEVAFQEAEYLRSKQTYEARATPLRLLQNAELNLKQARTRLEAAKRTKADYEAARSSQNSAPRRVTLRAPISGTVVAADFTPGQQIDPTKRLLTIVDLSRVWIEAGIYEGDLPSVRQARSAEIIARADQDRVYAGQLVAVGNVVDPLNRTLPITFEINNPDASLKIGMYVEARIPTGRRAKAHLVPASAVLTEEGQSFLFVEIQPGLYYRRVVTTGERSGSNVVIKTGLQVGERVVSVGAGSLRNESMKTQIPSGP